MASLDRMRGIRCSLVVGDVLTTYMQDVMESAQIPIDRLENIIWKNKKFLSKLSDEEKNRIQTLSTDRYRKLDINLMYKIAKYFRMFFQPSQTEWTNEPKEDEIELGDDMIRIKKARDFYGHNICPILSEQEMHSFFEKFIQVGKRADAHLKKTDVDSYELKILKYKDCTIDKAREEQLLMENEDLRRGVAFEIIVGKSIIKVILSDETKVELKRRAAKEDESTCVTFNFTEGIEDAVSASVRINQQKDLINMKSKHIKIKDATTGSLLLYLVIENRLFLNETLMKQEIEKFIQILSDEVNLRNNFGMPCYLLVTEDADDTGTDSSDDEVDEEKRNKQLILNLDVKNQVFKTEDQIKKHFSSFFEQSADYMNGTKIHERQQCSAILEIRQDMAITENDSEGNQEQKLVVTKSMTLVLEKVMQNTCVIITGSAGSGKSSTMHHIANHLQNTCGYSVISVCHPSDISLSVRSNLKQLFVVDDVMGINYPDQYRRFCWDKEIVNIVCVCESNPHVKIVMTCRSTIYNSNIFEDFKLPFYNCNLQSDQFNMSIRERDAMYETFNLEKIPVEISNDLIMSCSFFPFACTIRTKELGNTVSFFESASRIVQATMRYLKTKPYYEPSCVGLALLVIYDNMIDIHMFYSYSENLEQIIMELCKELDFRKVPSSEQVLKSLVEIEWVHRSKNIISFSQNILFDGFAEWFGCLIPECVIKYSRPTFIRDRVELNLAGEPKTDSTIVLPHGFKVEYINRLLQDLENGYIWEVIGGKQMKNVIFRCELIDILKDQDGVQILRYKTKQDEHTLLHVSSYLGYFELCKFVIMKNTELLFCKDKDGRTPLHYASVKRHEQIEKMFELFSAGISEKENIALETSGCSNRKRKILDTCT